MADASKEAQRAGPHTTIPGIGDDLRGSVDSWGFKSYVLGTLFYNFTFKNLTTYLSNLKVAPSGSNTGFRTAQLLRVASQGRGGL